ncbi:hypothetical protein OTB20_25555 [Streptomyces sp. H27-H1]|uniref:DUF6879 family protein n=1 Tax=unclassified Streptomyces TaxID=2593676 RepID=UPI00226F6131|nr:MULTISPECIES: DUF6879 family protein [unclassified Streptomyces]MCY0929506.1 hypothetical protein [Streptomyces sp. H27-H1]MCY0939663.1 hypothetical protein [Streptomyces sp. H34-S4]
MGAPSFEELLSSARHSAVHLEMRDGYGAEPALDAWRAGSREDLLADDPEFQQWLSLIREVTARGVVVRRARVFSVPESDYIRWEHFISDANVEAGEQIRWLPRPQATDIAFPGNDFWVIDSVKVLVLHHTGDGEPAPEYREFTDNPRIVDLCSSSFEAVWDRGVPHSEYKPS